MSNCLLNVVAQHLRFYYAVAESVKNSRDVVCIVFVGEVRLLSIVGMPCVHVERGSVIIFCRRALRTFERGSVIIYCRHALRTVKRGSVIIYCWHALRTVERGSVIIYCRHALRTCGERFGYYLL